MGRDGEQRQVDLSDTAEYVAFNEQVGNYYEAEPRTRMLFSVAGRTHPGLVRPNNEDHYAVVDRYRVRELVCSSLPAEMFETTEEHAYVMAVADGMGGRKFGELASLLALRIGWELGGEEIKWSMKVNSREVEDMKQKAEVFFRLVHEALHAEIRENPRLVGMGTTLTACYSIGPNLFVMHVGDSRAYHFSQGSLHQVTRDHNLGQLLIDAGEAQPDSPVVKRMHHVLTNVLGGPERSIHVEVHHESLADGDRVLLCTDGLTDMVTDDEIAQVLRDVPDPDTACRTLVDLALKNGGKDNVTVVIGNYRVQEDE